MDAVTAAAVDTCVVGSPEIIGSCQWQGVGPDVILRTIQIVVVMGRYAHGDGGIEVGIARTDEHLQLGSCEVEIGGVKEPGCLRDHLEAEGKVDRVRVRMNELLEQVVLLHVRQDFGENTRLLSRAAQPLCIRYWP